MPKPLDMSRDAVIARMLKNAPRPQAAIKDKRKPSPKAGKEKTR